MPSALEFILAPGITPVLIVAPYGPCYAAVMEKLVDSKSLQIVECSSPMDAVALARRVGVCILIFHATDQDALTKQATMLKLLGALLRQGKVRTILTTALKQDVMLQKVVNMGVNEVMSEPVSAKSLIFKLERHVKLLPQMAGAVPKAATPAAEDALLDDKTDPAVVRDTAQATSTKKKNKKAALLAAKAESEAKSTSTVKLVAPLELQSDFWLMAGGGAKRIGGRWVVKLTGPGPKNGRWSRVNDEESHVKVAQERWQWVPSDPETDPFYQEAGAWIFRGQRPEFQEKTWMFVGKAPDLLFYYEKESYGTKFILDSAGTLLIAKDSAVAHRFLTAIEETLSEDHPARDRKSKATQEEAAQTPAAPREVAMAAEEERPQEAEIKLCDPLALESDCWLIDDRKPRLIARRWVVKIAGPGPSAGRWLPLETEDHSDSYWQWTPTDPDKDPFIKEQGAWVFRGLMPKFEEDLWLFVGKKPELAFWYEGQSYGAKVRSESAQVLVVALDSENAIKLLPAIVASIERVINTREDESAAQALLKLQSTAGKKGAEERGEARETEDAIASVEPAPPTKSARDPSALFDAASEKAHKTRNAALSAANEGRELGLKGNKASREAGPETADFVEARESGGTELNYREKKKKAAVGDAFASFKSENKAGQLRDRRRPEKADDGTVQFRIPEAEIGTPGGVWEYVSANAGGGKWYVFVPIELLNRVIKNVRKIERYWVYCGPHRPELREAAAPGTPGAPGAKDWVFAVKEPDVVGNFDQLIQPIQTFLDGRMATADFVDESDEDRVYQDNTGARRKKKGHGGFPARGQNAVAKSKTGDFAPVRAAAPGAAKWGSRSNVTMSPEGPTSFRAPAPPGPSLSPLALAFLISELMCKRGLDRRMMSQRYCAYLSASCGGLRVELWINYPDRWVCAGTHDGSVGELGQAASVQCETGETAVTAEGVLISPIGNGSKGDGELIGAIALSGPGIELVDLYYAWAAGRMARGLMQSLVEAEIPLDQVG